MNDRQSVFFSVWKTALPESKSSPASKASHAREIITFLHPGKKSHSPTMVELIRQWLKIRKSLKTSLKPADVCGLSSHSVTARETIPSSNSGRHPPAFRTMKSIPLILIALLALAGPARAAKLKTQNVFLIISDGLRWQEVFTGAEEGLMNKDNGVEDVNALRENFWRDTPEARRAALLPFIWSRGVAHGQLFGNQTRGSMATVTNRKKFSYPGYNEILTGAPDPRIASNEKIPNPNPNVFEWLNDQSKFAGHVAVFGTWDVFPSIFNIERSKLPIWPASSRNPSAHPLVPAAYLTELSQDTPAMWDGLMFDSFLFQASRDYIRQQKPRALFIGFGETDEWAHLNRYDDYLTSAHNVDGFIRRLWETVQSLPQYRDKTTFIITADHGRGTGAEWRTHGENIVGAEGDWLVVIGPDTPPLGERTDCAAITESQIAATLAKFLGEDFNRFAPNAGKPIADVFGPSLSAGAAN
jgi:hypothetical protein